tara:strand:- start:1041 stop:1292 length:252 start_codon:yes stop_codon:yes gene_type:complete
MQQAFILLLVPFIALAAIEITNPPPGEVPAPPSAPIVMSSEDIAKDSKKKEPCIKKIQEQRRELLEELKKIKEHLKPKRLISS